VENDNANIVRKLQEAAKKYYQEYASYGTRRCYIGNSKRTKRWRNQQQHEAAKGTLKLDTFWKVKKVADEDDVEMDDNTNEHLDDEVESYN